MAETGKNDMKTQRFSDFQRERQNSFSRYVTLVGTRPKLAESGDGFGGTSLGLITMVDFLSMVELEGS